MVASGGRALWVFSRRRVRVSAWSEGMASKSPVGPNAPSGVFFGFGCFALLCRDDGGGTHAVAGVLFMGWERESLPTRFTILYD